MLLSAPISARALLLCAMYAVAAAACFFVAYEVRFDFIVPEFHQNERLRVLPLAVGLKLGALIFARQVGTLMTYFSLPDLLRLFWAVSGSSCLLLLPRFVGLPDYSSPRGVLLIDFMLCFGSLAAGRVALRVYRERLGDARRAAEGGVELQLQRIVIFGAGDAGAALAKEFVGSPARGFRPMMFFDDDPTKHGKLIHGIPVVGRPEMLPETKDTEGLAKAIIAMPSASAKRIREIVEISTRAGLKVETLPSLVELASGKVRASRVRPVEVQDLLGRQMVDLDSEGIRHAVEARVVLVTGAGGSIGSELCRQIAALNPKRLLLVEQSEGALFLIEQELNELGFGGVIVPLVADILDRPRMEFIFGRYRPQVVFHAAAHKHVYLMERQPAEAIRNNAFGTRQLALIAAEYGATAFVLISTDKAINPTNVMGATKRLAELQLMDVARRLQEGKIETKVRGGSSAPFAVTKFMAVRFGNVLGSSGSVIPIFKRQIANGGPVTVTHPDVTRYFMTIPEAVGLVLQSFVLGQGGEIFVLDMGQPVKIVDLAKQMIELSGFRVGDDIEIKFTGLKPGEKLFEELQHHTEEYAATSHPRIMQFKAKATLDASGLLELESHLHTLDSNQLKSALKQLVPEYSPHLD